MPSFAIIINLYVPKDIPTGFLTGFVIIVIEHFAFDCAERGFRTGIIITVALAAYAANHLVFFEKFLVVFTAILNATVRMMNESLGWSMPKEPVVEEPTTEESVGQEPIHTGRIHPPE